MTGKMKGYGVVVPFKEFGPVEARFHRSGHWMPWQSR